MRTTFCLIRVTVVYVLISASVSLGQQRFELNSIEFASKEEFVQQGRRCATHTLSVAQRLSLSSRRAQFAEANVETIRERTMPVTIPVLFHVIHDGATGKVSVSQLDEQLTVLNDSFSSHGIKFVKSGVDFTDNPTWYTMDLDTQAEHDAKEMLAKNTDRMLNFYTCNPPGGTLGWARFPWELVGAPNNDGVVILHSSLPDGDAAPYNLGDTAVHEVGHWLGLFHTFGESPLDPCVDTDEIGDTPAHRVNFGTPPDATDTCPDKPGNDPVHNFMNYVDDVHMDQLTAQQVVRLHEHIALFRPLLLTEPIRSRLKFDGYK